jgi:hypothetical protein
MLNGTPLLKLYARVRLRQLRERNDRAVQEQQLLSLVAKAQDTRFGRNHSFAEIRSVRDFQERVPLRKYDSFWADYWQPSFPVIVNATWPGTVPYFAVTSGTTTGVTKYIPCTEPMIASNIRAGTDLLMFHTVNRPHSRVLAGANFMLGGTTRLTQLAPGVQAGDISGILAGRIPWWAKGRHFPPDSIGAIPDWEERIEALAKAISRADIRSVSGTPSWLLILFDRLAALRPGSERRLAAFFPNLELLVHGGVSFAPYRPLFADLLRGSHAETREVYPASEGFMALADRGDGEGLRLMLDTGLFYEFVPVEELDSSTPTRHWIGTAQKDVNYAMVLSTCAGIWGYIVGDTVRFVDLDPPRILVTGRTSYMLSAFGEHLIGEEIETSVARAAAAAGARINDYAVGALFPEKEGDLGRHLFIVEFTAESAREGGKEERLETFAQVLDQSLAALNDDYRTHRERDYAMKAPKVHALKPGAFAAWMKSRGQLGDQHKVPRIINDQDLFQNLRDFVGADR